MQPTPLGNTSVLALAAALCLLLSTTAAQAGNRDQLMPAPDAEIMELERDAAELADALRDRPTDPDVADTALVFTNFEAERQRVLCAGFDANGAVVGWAHTAIPGHGVRYLLASDLSQGLDYVGHAQCAATRWVRGTAIFLGPGLTDLPSTAVRGRFGRIKFPLVATY